MSGSVIAYNYVTSPYTTDASGRNNILAGLNPHYPQNFQNLYEGNEANKLLQENIWGSGDHNTVCPNYSNSHIYILAYYYDCNMGNDPLVYSTLLRGGNYDVFSGTTVWSSNVPSGTGSQYLSSQGLPNSLYLSGRPAFFNTDPAWVTASTPAAAWPPIGNDVTNSARTGVDRYVYDIPAKLCYLNIPAKGTQFDSSKCYYK